MVDRVDRAHGRPSFDERIRKYLPDDAAGRIRPMGETAADKVGGDSEGLLASAARIMQCLGPGQRIPAIDCSQSVGVPSAIYED